jgi:hypothetical protein
MIAIRIWRLLLALVTLGAIWAIATPAQAQLVAGCACAAGTVPNSSITCLLIATKATVPAICPLRNVNIAQIASSQQQQSFWGINQMLQQKRDQLQYTPAGGATAGPKVSGFAASDLDGEGNALSYADQSRKGNPLASTLYDAAEPPAQATPVWGVWAQGLGDWEHGNPLSATDLGHFSSSYTAQAGLDRTMQGVLSKDDALVLGIVSSWTSSHVSYDNMPTKLQLLGPGIGVYTEYVRGGFSTDVTAKFDFLGMTQDFGGSQPNASVNVLNAGVSGNAQYKFTGENNNFLEPTVGFSLTHTGFGSGGAALDLEDTYTVRLQAGARAGTTWYVGHDVTIDTNLKALVYGDAVAQSSSAGGPIGGIIVPLAPSDAGLVRGELDPEISFNLPDKYSVTLSGQVRFGEAIVGGSAGVNLRKQW